MYSKFDMWVLWRHQHFLNFLGKKFGVTKRGVLHSCLFWFYVSQIMTMGNIISKGSLGIFFGVTMGIVSLLFAIYLTAIATMSCRSKEMAYKIWVSSFVDRIIWWILAPIDVLLLFSVVMHGGLTLLNWGSFLDTPLILMLFYFSSCVEAPPKQKKEQLKTAYA